MPASSTLREHEGCGPPGLFLDSQIPPRFWGIAEPPLPRGIAVGTAARAAPIAAASEGGRRRFCSAAPGNKNRPDFCRRLKIGIERSERKGNKKRKRKKKEKRGRGREEKVRRDCEEDRGIYLCSSQRAAPPGAGLGGMGTWDGEMRGWGNGRMRGWGLRGWRMQG